MGWTYIGSAKAANDASGTTLDCTSDLNIAEGDLLVGVTHWENTDTTAAIAEAGGGNAFTMLSIYGVIWSMFSCAGYKIAAAADATATMRFTLAVAAPYRRIIVLQFRPDAGETVSLDAQGGWSSATSTALLSNNITTAGTDEVVVGVHNSYYNRTPSDVLIADAAPDGIVPDLASDSTFLYYSIFIAAKANIHSEATLSSSSLWAADILSFKSVAAAGGLSIPVAMLQMDQFAGGVIH